MFDGDHDEADCAKRGWSRTMVHHTFVDALCRFLKDCGMDDVMSEVKYWDPARIGSDGSSRVGRIGGRTKLMLTTTRDGDDDDDDDDDESPRERDVALPHCLRFAECIAMFL